jgi:PPOX class probable F420-dependent enzyme
MELEPRLHKFIESHRVAHLATVDAHGRPSVVPVCYAFINGTFYSVIDEKPKTVRSSRLRRIENIRSNPNVALVIDDYSEDWQRLAYVHVRGRAAIIEPDAGDEYAAAIVALRQKYPQYRSMKIEVQPMIRLVPENMRFWSAGSHENLPSGIVHT